MQAVSASTSAGSTAGYIAMRSWLRPSLRYGSVSTMPLARNAFATAAASTPSSKSIVPTTCERSAGSVTYGVAYVGRLGPAVDRGRASAVRLARPGEAALRVEPVDLLGHQEDRGQRRGVVRLVEPRAARPPWPGRGTRGSSGRTP